MRQLQTRQAQHCRDVFPLSLISTGGNLINRFLWWKTFQLFGGETPQAACHDLEKQMSWRRNQVMQLLSESIPGLVAFQLETAMVLDVCPGDPELFHVGFHKRWLLPPQRTQQRFVHPDILIRVRILTSRHDSKRHWRSDFSGAILKTEAGWSFQICGIFIHIWVFP